MQDIRNKVKVIAFDADDTLWDNQSYYDDAEKIFCSVLADYADSEAVSSALLRTETRNMQELGYGAKAFTLSMIETALELSGGRISGDKLGQILDAGKAVLKMSCCPLPGVREALEEIKASGKYEMVLFTKGDLLDQRNKLVRSGLEEYFGHVGIVADKTVKEYWELCGRMGVDAGELVMVGNSFRSDIEPVLKIGGFGIHVPFERTWQHEVVEEYDHERLFRVASFAEIPGLLL